MKKRNILVVLLILLLIICAMSYIFILADNTNKINNDSIFNNSTNLQNKQNDKNISLNHTNNTDDGIEGNINNTVNQESYSANINKKNNYENKSKSVFDENKSNNKFDNLTEEELKELIRTHVAWHDGKGGTTHDVRIGEIYKTNNLWLVPAFDKKTGEFLEAVWTGPMGHGFFGGVDSYSKYVEIISGKYNHDSNKPNKGYKPNPIEEIPDSSDFHVLAAVNPEVKDNYPSSNIPLDTQSESVIELDANQQYSVKSNETA